MVALLVGGLDVYIESHETCVLGPHGSCGHSQPVRHSQCPGSGQRKRREVDLVSEAGRQLYGAPVGGMSRQGGRRLISHAATTGTSMAPAKL